MAVVYLAEHEKLGNQVAIKVLSDVLVSSKSVRERFIQEARMMVSLRHSGIVTVTDFIETDKSLAIVMDYIEGRSLDEMIGYEVGPIPYEKALPIFKRILEAVAYAHSKGIIHRDLKPANILVSNDGEVKVTDFGIAKIAGQNGLTKTGMQMGTLYYESPEQIMGAGNVDQRADIYSLGMTLFEMLAGRLPFDDEQDTSEYRIMDAIVKREEELDPRIYYPHVPEWLVLILQKALKQNAEDRIPTCADFLRLMREGRKTELAEESSPAVFATRPDAHDEPSPRTLLTEKSHSSAVEEDVPRSHSGKIWIAIAALLVAIVIVIVVVNTTSQDNSARAPEINASTQEEVLEDVTYASPVIVGATSYDHCDPINDWTYEPTNLYDGDWDTAWCAAYVPGDSWFTLYLEEESRVGKIGIVPGFAKSGAEVNNLFNKNYRVRNLRIEFPSGRVIQCTLLDHPSMQYIDIVPYEVTDRITVHIDDVYQTALYEDLAISEVSVHEN